ncbi:YybH family protein [Chitinophaga niabensis]|uniref:Ketosteroid isomerase homolog n=1 Tax=Chitinophaga niabensis TaxID=536979 RepID=A0A1N6K3K1_9BACT|nr:DUF4440 domain-containing protein [Chitinophaga niabensis]SIO50907.1 Ketosteroid isomerase homolog [Chitinophaga niabensis]
MYLSKWLFPALFICFLSPARAADPRERIEALNQQFAKALEKGDVSAMMRYYAADAVSMPEHHPTLFNRAAITQYFQQWLKATSGNRYQRTIYSIKAADGYLLESGTYTHDFTQPGQQPFRYAGKYVHIWRIGKKQELTLVSEIWGAAAGFDHAALPLLSPPPTPLQITPIKPADSALARTINTNNAAIAQLVKDRNGAAFSEYYTDDAIYMPYYMPMVIGKDSIHQYYVIHEDPNVGIDTVRINISRILPAGDYVLVNGYYCVNWRAGGNSGLVTGKSINIWKKEPDGKLRLYWQMTNHD